MRSLKNPIIYAGVESGVANAIRTPGQKYLNIIQFGAACALQNDIELVGRSGVFIEVMK